MLGLIFLGLSFVLGIFLLNWLDRSSSFSNFRFLIFSLGLGLVVGGYSALVLALILKSLFYGLMVFSIFGVAAGILFFRKIINILKDRFLPSGLILKFLNPQNIFLFLIIGIVVLLGLQAMLWDSQGFPFGILKGWGDGAYHLNMVSRLAQASPFVLDQPIAGGRILSYPFLVNFLSAIFYFGGLPLAFAWYLPGIIFGPAMVLAFYQLGRKFFHKKSLAVVFVFLILFGAGLGWLWFFQEVKKDSAALGLANSLAVNFIEPKFEYSHLDSRTGGKLAQKELPENIVWIAPAISFFSHQRSFVIGGFLGALFLLGFLGSFDWRYLLVLGLMPLAHTHSFLALSVLSLALVIFSGKFSQSFNKLSFLAAATALPQLVYLLAALKLNGSHKFIPWFGWMTCDHSTSWFFCDANVLGADSSVLWFLLKNFGLIFVFWLLSVFVLWFNKKESKLKDLVLPSLVLFLLPNILLFQPWPFDNNKFIFWWWTLAAALALSLFDVPPKNDELRIKNKGFLKSESIIRNSLFILFVFGSSFAGVIDVFYRLQSGLEIRKNIRSFGYYGEAEKKLADWIKKNTEPNDIFLTTSEPSQFVPMLSGRAIYLGFTGWLWTQGGDKVIFERKTKIERFIETGKAEELCLDGVRYWLAESDFFREYPISEKLVETKNTVFQLDGKKIVRLDCVE
ncbi:MAG: hypothetical protein UX26_C0010G0012 [Parcubacteria group bacterium GW2011_GWC1_45_9]|nr:MAG: hypothetical protein UX26_C0010G0012 [Parcubacteria group bacterium GW2011_GWC1_45_9]HCI05558.1 hypothetical protein [Patescibacteria group bacterium]